MFSYDAYHYSGFIHFKQTCKVKCMIVSRNGSLEQLSLITLSEYCA